MLTMLKKEFLRHLQGTLKALTAVLKNKGCCVVSTVPACVLAHFPLIAAGLTYLYDEHFGRCLVVLLQNVVLMNV